MPPAFQLVVPVPPPLPPESMPLLGVSPCEGVEERHETERPFYCRTDGGGGDGGRGAGFVYLKRRCDVLEHSL